VAGLQSKESEGSVKAGEFLYELSDYQLLERDSALWSWLKIRIHTARFIVMQCSQMMEYDKLNAIFLYLIFVGYFATLPIIVGRAV
jgi:hypothetical protein